MSLTCGGHELLYVHPDGFGGSVDLAAITDVSAFKAGFGFRLFGGDKIWVAPQREWLHRSPPVDLDAGRYSLERQDGWLVMVSPVCRETGLRIVRRVRLEDGGTIHLEDELENATDRTLSRGIWNVTQLYRPVDIYIDAGPQDIRSYHLEDPTLPEPSVTPGQCGGWSGLACHSAGCFKFGGVPRTGRACSVQAFAGELVAFARVFEIDHGATYAHGSAVEVFNSDQYPYAELELHAPLGTIPPGGSVCLRQTWRLMRFSAGAGINEIAGRLFPAE